MNHAADQAPRRALFASDFHLSAQNPGEVHAFCEFIGTCVAGASEFFILGDLFDLWIGPAQLAMPALAPAVAALRAAAERGTRIVILRGNRDFLLGAREGRAMGAEIAADGREVMLQGRRLLLAHGDSFCTRDRSYQRMKRFLRSRPVLWLAGGLPAGVVWGLARRLRRRSTEAIAGKTSAELAIETEAVERAARAARADAVLCGHVHAPEERVLPGGGRLYVLSEWAGGRGIYAELACGAIRLLKYPGEGRPAG